MSSLSQTFGDKTSRERPFAALRVTLLERCPGCHSERMSRSPERSEGEESLHPSSQTLRCAQGDRHYLQMSISGLLLRKRGDIIYVQQSCPPKSHLFRLYNMLLDRKEKVDHANHHYK